MKQSEKVRRAAEFANRSTKPTINLLLAWVALALGAYVLLEAFDVLDTHVEVDPGPLEELALTLEHIGLVLLAIPAIITGYRMVRRVLRKK